MPDISWISYLPWVFLALTLVPVIALAWVWRIFPTTRWAIPLSIAFGLSVVSVFVNSLVPVLIVVDFAVLGLLVTDLMTIVGRSHITVERQVDRAASIGVAHPVLLRLDNRGTRKLRIDVRDDVPDGFAIKPEMQHVKLPPGKRVELTHVLRSNRRGAFDLENVYIRMHSALGFWIRLVKKPLKDTLHVYPDMQQVSKYAILARTNRLSLMGVKRTRKAGQDNNFERLRDYTLDDNFKHIDWRSTARRQKLTVKQFQTDQSQRIIFMLDCGRMMTNEYQGLSLVDYALNSILMLSYVALKQGDSVGMVSFSDSIHDFVPLRGGPSQMNRILHAGFNRFPNLVQSRFDQAFLYLSNHCRRRSMVVLITNVIDEMSASQITGYMSNLSGHHLPLLVLLRDHRMFDSADNPSLSDDVLYRSAAAAQILTWRHDVLRRLTRSGVLVVDAFPEQMTSPLINSYLEAKAKHLL
jgi:uncharacterized protein (DUF58 family)